MKRIIIITGLCLSIMASAQQTGSIASNAKEIEAARLQDFKNGYAVVSYGSGKAILDSKGNFALDPKIYSIQERDLIRHLIKIEENSSSWPRKQGIYDLQKKSFLVPISDKYAITAQDDFFVFDDPKASTRHIMDTYGNKSKTMSTRIMTASVSEAGDGAHDGDLKKISDHLFRIMDGYVKFGEEEATINKGKWGTHLSFSNGLAAVQAVDPATNKAKWGFLNKQGEFAIKPTFTIQPSNFYNGMAMVYPTDARAMGFKTAFIDKTGKLVIRLPYKLRNEASSRFYRGAIVVKAPVQNESTRSGQTTFIIKKDGTILDLTTKIASTVEGLVTVTAEGYAPLAYGNLIAVKVNLRKGMDPYALVDLDGNYAFPLSNFKKIYPFDEASGLSRASFVNEDGSVTEGYINSQGVFQIVLKKDGGAGW